MRGERGESSAEVARRVRHARQIQVARFGEQCPNPINAAMGTDAIRLHCNLEESARKLLDAAFDRLSLSARALTRILKVARTIADLEASPRIAAAHVAETVQYRSMDQRSEER